MSYRLEQKDIVISGFEKGISDSPYKGISDMRNVDIISVPGEASTAFAPSLTTTQTAITNAVFTVDPATEIFTWAGSVALANNTAVTFTNSGGALPTGLVANTAYYISNTTATTFKLSVDGSGNSCASGGSIKNITGAGSGTNTFSTINIAKPKFTIYQKYNDTSNSISAYLYYGLDSNGRCWYYSGGSQWVYMNNLNGENTANNPESGNGLIGWKNTLFNFRQQNLGYILTNVIATGVPQSLAYQTTYSNWNITWQSLSKTAGYPNDVSHYAYVGRDDVVYFCNGAYVGSIIQVSGSVFDPTSAATYTYTQTALALPTNDQAICLAELGTNLLTGGITNAIYPWNRTATSFSYPILISESNIMRMVTVNTTTYIFAGQRGRIYKTNGTQAQLFKKMPDHLSNTVNPYYTWGDAVFNRNQLYFGVQATDNAGTAINQYGGTWAIDLDTDALRLVNQQSYGTYAGITSALCAIQGTNTSDGLGLLMGWYTSSNTTGGIDKSSSTPYTGGQSYVDSDIIPVGTFLKTFTPSQVEWKTSVPLGGNGTSETIALYYRLNLTASYAIIGTTSSTTGQVSDYYTTNFQNAQWVQIRAVLTSNATTPTYNRLTEIRIREFIK